MKNENYIKVPSHFSSVNVPNIRRFIGNSDKLDKLFEKEDLQNIKELTIKSEGARGRLLSYVKYLGVLSEKRSKKQIGNKEITIRQYYLTDLGKELQQAKLISPSKFEDKWREVLLKSELYQAITESAEHKENNYISRKTIRELIRKGFSENVKHITERLDKSEKFLRQLLEDGHIFAFDGEYYRPIIYNNIVSERRSNYLLHINESNFELKIKEWNNIPKELIAFIARYTEYKKSYIKINSSEEEK